MRQAAGGRALDRHGFVFRSKQVILPGFELSGLTAHCRAALMSGDIPPVVCVCFYSRSSAWGIFCAVCALVTADPGAGDAEKRS